MRGGRACADGGKDEQGVGGLGRSFRWSTPELPLAASICGRQHTPLTQRYNRCMVDTFQRQATQCDPSEPQEPRESKVQPSAEIVLMPRPVCCGRGCAVSASGKLQHRHQLRTVESPTRPLSDHPDQRGWMDRSLGGALSPPSPPTPSEICSRPRRAASWHQSRRCFRAHPSFSQPPVERLAPQPCRHAPSSRVQKVFVCEQPNIQNPPPSRLLRGEAHSPRRCSPPPPPPPATFQPRSAPARPRSSLPPPPGHVWEAAAAAGAQGEPGPTGW